MKLILITILLFAFVPTFAQTPAAPANKKFALFLGVGRSAPITEYKFERNDFNISITATFKISKRLSFNASLVENMTFRRPILRTGISWRIF